MHWTDLKHACRALEDGMLGKAGIEMVYIGFKEIDGKMTDRLCVTAGVRRKLAEADVPKGGLVPSQVGGFPTDVVEVGQIRTYPQTARVRPAPGGYSVGHFGITAGTIGAWVLRGTSGRSHILSNNHVLADSNGARIGDAIFQPGRADGGSSADRIAALTEYVRIRFEGPGGKKKLPGLLFWRIAKAVPNAIAALAGCPNRLIVAAPNVVDQPYPNLVDAAVAAADSEADVARTISLIGPVVGIRDLTLGDVVQKSGRTTDLTRSTVTGVNASVIVSYGPGKTARFRDQIVIGGSGFSAPGDSGSAIMTADRYLGGLLFAGGDNTTIANRISHVVALLGLRL